MKLALDRLTDSPTPFVFEGGAAWWRSSLPGAPGLPGELDEPLHISVRAHRMGDDVYVEGSLEGDLELECSRCLARYRHRLSESFRLVLEPAGSRLPADPEAAEALLRDGVCLGEDIDTGWFQGSELRLGPFFHEIATLALPVQPLCREDCAGLCPRCGADRNRESCECREIETESPFAVLRTLRGGQTEGEI
jgi:uncharacterized protein